MSATPPPSPPTSPLPLSPPPPIYTQVCSEAYGLAPEVVVSGDMSARLPYLTSHLDYMVYELLKNAMRAGEARQGGGVVGVWVVGQRWMYGCGCVSARVFTRGFTHGRA